VPGVIDLRSDTATIPSPEMLAAMAAAEVGDEQAQEDPTVNELQRRAAELLGHEAALFLPTATMANQIALRVLTRPGTALIAEERTHILIFEAGGPAVHSGLMARPIPGVAGRLTPEQLREAIMLTATIAGFPPAMNAMSTLKSVLADRDRADARDDEPRDRA
jgi:threonine aldolase